MNFKSMDFKSLQTTPLQKIFVLAVMCLVFIFFNLLLDKIFVRPSRVAVDKTSPRFSATRAFDTTREYVTQFPQRLFGSLESRQSTGYLTDRLTAMGYEVEHVNFDGRIGGGQRAGRNVLAYKQGKTDEIIAVTAHFDTARPTVQGAAKNGAAVGVLMELAELFSEENTMRSMLFVFTDGGEWGSTGANDLCLNYANKDRIAAVLTLDYVAPGDLGGFRLETTGQLHGSTPPGLIRLAEETIREQTSFSSVESIVTKLLENVFMISNSEQGAFLKSGIPAINLGSFSTDGKREKDILHSPGDVIENLKIETIDKYGRVAEQMIRSLTQSPEIPRFKFKSNNVWKQAKSICAGILFLMCIILLVQILVSRKIHKLAQAGRELLAFFAAWTPFLVLFLGIRLAYAARQFPFYDLYPAIAKDPVMQSPPWKVFVIIAAGVALVAIADWIIARYFLREWSKPDYQNSCAVLFGVLVITIFLAGAYNPFWGVVFCTAPFVLWPIPQNWKLSGCGIVKRIACVTYTAAAAVPAVVAFWWLAARLGFGWNFFWYQALALTTGLFSPFAYFMGTAVIAAGIRFIAITALKR